MKKIILCILLLLVTSLPVISKEKVIKDVSPDDWAYKAIKAMIEKGYLALYDDGTFKADQPVSRKILAHVVYRLLEEIESGKTQLLPQELQDAKKLAKEFKEEIALSEDRLKRIEKKLDEIDSEGLVLHTDLTKISYETQKSVEELKEENKFLNKELLELKEQFKRTNAQRKRMETFMWIGIIAAAAAGFSD